MNIRIDPDSIAARFMRYVAIDTQSDPDSITSPTTEKQKDLARLLTDELRAMGVAAETDMFGYVYATLTANSQKGVPVICFLAHMDTAPDCSGTGVKPIYHRDYDGSDIVLPDDPSQVLRISDSPYLKEHIGSDIITASGLTLLGADDKAGVAAIMEAALYLTQNPQVKHGTIKIVFTPDEEVGKGTDKIDLEKIGAQFAYTLDGGEAGALEDETFSADGATITVDGVIAHPGYAKDKLVNAIKIVGAIVDALPKDEWCPERTEGREGFVHPVAINGIAERAALQFIVRDFDTAQLAKHHTRLKKLAEDIVAQYPRAMMRYEVKQQYRNMKEVLDRYPQVAAHAEEAIKRAGLSVRKHAMRGGTDGSMLSFKGLPCPNLFTGMQSFHGKLEWVGTRDMAQAAETIIHLANLWEEKS